MMWVSLRYGDSVWECRVASEELRPTDGDVAGRDIVASRGCRGNDPPIVTIQIIGCHSVTRITQ